MFWRYLEQFGVVLDYFDRARDIWWHLEPRGAIWSRLEPFGANWTNLEPFGVIWSHFEPFRPISSHLEPFGAIWSPLEQFGAIWSHLEPFGPFLLFPLFLLLIPNLFKASALWADAFYKSKCPSVCLSVCVSVCLFTFEVPFNGLFAPTSRSWMSNIFRDSESLGKSNRKKWSNIWTFLFGSGLKSPRKKSFFVVADFALQNMVETTLPDGLETSGPRAYR